MEEKTKNAIQNTGENEETDVGSESEIKEHAKGWKKQPEAWQGKEIKKVVLLCRAYYCMPVAWNEMEATLLLIRFCLRH
jgi:hypothetical protein